MRGWAAGWLTGHPLCVDTQGLGAPWKLGLVSVRRSAADEHGQGPRPSGPGGSPPASRGQALGRTREKVPLGCPTFHLTPDPRHTHLALKTHGKFMKHLHEGDTFYPSSPQLLASSPNSYPTPAIPFLHPRSSRIPPVSLQASAALLPHPPRPRFSPDPSLHPSLLLPEQPPGHLWCPPTLGLSQTQKHAGTQHTPSTQLSPRPLRPGFVPSHS